MNVSTPHSPTTVRTFVQQLSSTRRGARLARLLAVAEFQTWQVPPSVAERAEHIVAELAANAAQHGRVQGRDFRLTLHLDPAAGLLRIAVTDARGDRLPAPTTDLTVQSPDAESGRGLLMVTALADRWGTEPCPPGGKTVWAELVTLPASQDCSTPRRSGATHTRVWG
jgi:anti-sigma regulatory factor (Ser/Thr protein kinase)